jgi:hypothetical protein
MQSTLETDISDLRSANADPNSPQSYVIEALGIDPFDEQQVEAFIPINITLEKVEWILGKIYEYQKEEHVIIKTAEAYCQALREQAESQCVIVMESAKERSETFANRMNALVRNFGLSIKAHAIAAISASKKRSYKFPTGVGTAALKTNNPRIKLSDDKDMAQTLLDYAKEYIPGAVRYAFEPLTHEAMVAFQEFAANYNSARHGIAVDISAKLDRRELLAAFELRNDAVVDETSGVIIDNEVVAIKGTDGIETVPPALIVIKPEETFTLTTPVGEIELHGLEGMAN